MWIKSQDETILVDISRKYLYICDVEISTQTVDVEYRLLVDDVASISANTKLLLGTFTTLDEAKRVLFIIANWIMQENNDNRVFSI